MSEAISGSFRREGGPSDRTNVHSHQFALHTGLNRWQFAPMPHWLIKSAIQRTISLLPASQVWNSLFQTYVTRSLDLSALRFEGHLDHCRIHLENLAKATPSVARDFTVMEIGTGWYPVVPVGLFLCGAGEIQTFDIDPLLRPDRMKRMLDRFVGHHETGALAKSLPGVLPERMARLREAAGRAQKASPVELLSQFNIHPHVRGAQDTGLKDGTIDLFVSTGVLEYIPPVVLKAVLAECRRLGSPRATHSHYLNLVDQYWYFDRSITPFNFLRYSSNQWKFFNSPLTWQNRMRISDFRQTFTETGYKIIQETNTSGSLEDLKKIRLAPEFQNHAPEDLLVLTSWLVAKPAGP